MKEIIICAIIIILVILLNYLFLSQTNNSLNNISSRLEYIKEELIKLTDEESNTSVMDKIEELEKQWEITYYTLAFYIEHDELEKVENNLISVKSFIESKEYNEAISDLDKSLFTLSHINEKYLFKLQNIF